MTEASVLIGEDLESAKAEKASLTMELLRLQEELRASKSNLRTSIAAQESRVRHSQAVARKHVIEQRLTELSDIIRRSNIASEARRLDDARQRKQQQVLTPSHRRIQRAALLRHAANIVRSCATVRDAEEALRAAADGEVSLATEGR